MKMNMMNMMSMKKLNIKRISLLILAVAILIIGVLLITKKIKIMDHFTDANGSSKVIFYSMDKCGHCVKFAPEWSVFEKVVSKEGITAIHYDTADKKGFEEIEKAGIASFPTIMVNGKEYSGDRTCEAIYKATTGKDDAGKCSASRTN